MKNRILPLSFFLSVLSFANVAFADEPAWLTTEVQHPALHVNLMGASSRIASGIGSSPETGGSPVITDYLANLTIQKLLFLVTENKSSDIHMYINSPGGSVSATLALYDTMQFID